MNESASTSGKQPESPTRSPSPPVDVPSPRAEMPEETYAERNFDKVNFGQWHIKTWSMEGTSSPQMTLTCLSGTTRPILPLKLMRTILTPAPVKGPPHSLNQVLVASRRVDIKAAHRDWV